MAIDPVREKHETWVKGIISIFVWSVFAFLLWSGLQHHQAWDDFVREYWIWPMLAVSTLPWRWSPTAASLIFPILAWVEFHDKSLTTETLRHLSLVNWCLVFANLLCIIFLMLFLYGMVLGKRPISEKLAS